MNEISKKLKENILTVHGVLIIPPLFAKAAAITDSMVTLTGLSGSQNLSSISLYVSSRLFLRSSGVGKLSSSNMSLD
uniref:Uncharacterized protein n=1 Tax=Octopus bimaculoides TaxID=37653 RepID=A0A0L8G3G2_OCTBM